VGQGLSLFVRKLGIKLIANHGPVSVQAQNHTLALMARHGLAITSTEDEIHITAKKKITLNAGGSYITLDPSSIESGTAGDYKVKAAHFDYSGAARQSLEIPPLAQLSEHQAESVGLSDFSA
jgi:type VI secretion system secreted protein VgrG